MFRKSALRIRSKNRRRIKSKEKINSSRFERLDGRHPWRDAAPDGYIDYQAYYRPGGRVLYFNFPLAKEMGLISSQHSERMNKSLSEKILETFSIQIVNEFDLAHPDKIAHAKLRPRPYMATRYLQMQHRDKCGRTSGDGRSIWNGCIKYQDRIFDVSSRGTGATILSPGAQVTDQLIETGKDHLGYASGTADLDEMLGSAIMSEIFYRQGLPTERCLTVIDYGDGTSIGVRTAPNLVRPAHIFRYLKMGKHAELKKSMEYFMRRQEENQSWLLPIQSAAKLPAALNLIAKSYGKLAAVLEEEYIFNWLSWDGDNVLADGSILDYGSIRQFASKHDKYRYEDVDHFSSSLNEQKKWARQMVQAFAQAVDFIQTEEKKPLPHFKEAKVLAEFDLAFKQERDSRMLWRMGFDHPTIKKLLKNSGKEIEDFRQALTFFEDLKIIRGPEKLPDGIDHRPIFLIRSLLRQLPQYFLNKVTKNSESEKAVERIPEKDVDDSFWMDTKSFCRIMAASYASKRDLVITPARVENAQYFQACYLKLVQAAGTNITGPNFNFSYLAEALKIIANRADIINNPHRMTGDGMIWIVDEIVKFKDKLSWNELQDVLELFIESQVLVPGRWKPIPKPILNPQHSIGKLLRKIQNDLERYKETV